MQRDPDWEALHQLNFLLAPRVSSPLNEALNALVIADLGGDQIDPQLWYAKARARIANLLNLYQAWSALIQHKNGVQLPQNSIRAFPVQALLDWLTVELELTPPAIAKDNINLYGNQASIQEALLLLYSAATTQGSGVHLSLEHTDQGYWFRVRFSRPTTLPATLEKVISEFSQHWRSQDSAFELKMAQDFIALNGGTIEVSWNGAKKLGEFAFFVTQAVGRDSVVKTSPDVEHAQFVENIHRSMMPAPPKSTETSLELPPSQTLTLAEEATIVVIEGTDQQAEGQADSTDMEDTSVNDISKGDRLLLDLQALQQQDRETILLPDDPTVSMSLNDLKHIINPPHLDDDTVQAMPAVKIPQEDSPKVSTGNPPVSSTPQETS